MHIGDHVDAEVLTVVCQHVVGIPRAIEDGPGSLCQLGFSDIGAGNRSGFLDGRVRQVNIVYQQLVVDRLFGDCVLLNPDVNEQSDWSASFCWQ